MGILCMCERRPQTLNALCGPMTQHGPNTPRNDASPSLPLPNEVLRATKQIFYFVSSTSFPFLRLTNPSRVSSRQSGLPRQLKGDCDLEIQAKICWTEFIFVTTENCAGILLYFIGPTLIQSGSGSSVGIATGYGMDGSGIESRWGRDFPNLSRTGPGAHPASCTMGTGSFPGLEAAGAWVWPPTPIQCRGPKKSRANTSTHPKGLRGL